MKEVFIILGKITPICKCIDLYILFIFYKKKKLGNS